MIIEIAIATSVGGIIGFGACAVLTAGKVADAQGNADLWEQSEQTCSKHFDEVSAAHALCSDSRNTLLARIDRLKDIASNQQSVKSRRIIAVLEGRA